ncbi:tRNA epoxyqueuosine(34) reductase QueG [Agitococcus lubricus]|uniref:Epoxyqueuosine reductase n=1 Tax=Agitococcus lubricus TaxID=1077255 RepID=A0A2T5IZL2_9GAMM|nr:tRNA epoxyqueuosine(34) reductase QueG [Agitococcus lubricus]PTQ89498.1 epoxyqueuosine reductase [Agitococcus lubricus]
MIMQKIPLLHDMQSLTQEIKRWGHELGFQQVGISGVDLGQHGQHLQNWLAKGYHADLDYMASHGAKRWQPDLLEPYTQRIISVRMDYLVDKPAPRTISSHPQQGVIARYALGRDYHKVLRKRLQKLAERIETHIQDLEYRAFVDSAPVLERAIAEQAGLGWIGKNTMLINRQAGSFFFLGELFTNLPLIIDQPSSAHCGSCSACLDICPTQAIVAPYQLDARLCIAYLTIEYTGVIPEHLRSLIGNRVFGCDDCQLICPWNRYANLSQEVDFQVRHQLDRVSLLTLWSWTEAEFLQRTEGSPLRRIGYQAFMRNIAIGLGNAPPSKTIIEALQQKQPMVTEMVQEHIIWAIKQQEKTF